ARGARDRPAPRRFPGAGRPLRRTPRTIEAPSARARPGSLVSYTPSMVSRQPPRLLVLLLALAPAAGLAEARLERALSALRQDPSFKVRAQAALLLGQGGSGEAVPALRQALAEDPEPAVRIAAAAALGRLGDPAARDALAAAEGGDRDAKVREAAGRVLIELRSAPPGRVLSIEEAQGSAASASARETLRASLARHLALRGFSVV